MTRVTVFLGVTIILIFQFDVGSTQNFDPGMNDKEYLDKIQERLNEEVMESHQVLVNQTKVLQHVTKAFIESKIKENLFKAVRARVEVELDEMTKANATVRARQARQDDYDDEFVSTTPHPSRQGLLPQLANVVTSLFGSSANVTGYVQGATAFLGPDLSNRFINAASLIDPVRFSTTLAPILINGQLVHPDAIINGTFAHPGQNGVGLNLNQAQQSAQFPNPASGRLPSSGVPQRQTSNVGDIPSAAALGFNQVPQSNQFQTRQQVFQQQQQPLSGNPFPQQQQVNSQNGQNQQPYQFQQPQNQFQQQPQSQFQQNQFQQPQNQFQQQQNGQNQQPNNFPQQQNHFQQQQLNQFQQNSNLQQQNNPHQQNNFQQQSNLQQPNNLQQQNNQFQQNQQHQQHQQQYPYQPQQQNNVGTGLQPGSNNGQFASQQQQQQQVGGLQPNNFPLNNNNNNFNGNRPNGLNNGPPAFPVSDAPLDSNENSNEDNSSAEGENGSVTGTTGRYFNRNPNPTGSFTSSSKPLDEEDDDSSEDDLPVFYDDISDGDKTTKRSKPKPTTAAPIIAGGYLDEYPAIKYAFKLFNKLTTTKQEIPTTTEYTNVTRKSIDSLEEEEMAATSPSTTTVSRLVQGGVAIYEGAREAYTLLQHLNKFLDRVNDRFETAGYGAEEVGVPVGELGKDK